MVGNLLPIPSQHRDLRQERGTSISYTIAAQPAGPHHFAIASASVQAHQARSTLAA